MENQLREELFKTAEEEYAKYEKILEEATKLKELLRGHKEFPITKEVVNRELFLQTRTAYQRWREAERDYIVSRLREEGIAAWDADKEEVYNKLEPPYNLSNWLGIKAYVNGREYYISLQAFDQDKTSKNYHILMDRIGIYPIQDKKLKIKLKEINDKRKDIVLPMDEGKIDALVDLLKGNEPSDENKSEKVREGNDKFSELKEKYKKLREEQRDKIIEYLTAHLKKEFNSIKEFQGRNRKYDRSNWFGIDIIINNKTAFFISLQAFDKDKNSGNYHVLMDRIGIYQYPSYMVKKYMDSGDSGDLDTSMALYDIKITDVDLPLDETKLKQLVDFLEEQINAEEK